MASYVELRGEDYMLTGSRVSLASVVASWKEGLSAESIRDEFPSLSLEQVYGAITYYLANQAALEECFSSLDADFERRRAEQEKLHPSIGAKLRSALGTARH